MPTPAIAKTSTPDAATGNPIDVVTLNPGAGVADRQVVALGDPTTGTNYAAISAAGAVKVDASSVAVPVTGTFFQTPQPVSDNAGSLTVDAPVGTPVFARLSDGAAVLIGQKVMASSLPVAFASDQTSIPVTDAAGSFTVDAPVGTPVFVRLSDGAAALVGQKTMANSLPVTLASDQTTLPAVSEIRAATLHVTNTAAVNTALTVTLPAAGAGLFHYITSIQWVKLYSVIGIANGAGVLITTTNLPGNPIWTTEQLASAAGTAPVVINYEPTTPLKSSVANTATTIVAPLQLQTIWRGNVSYFTAV